MFPGKRRTKHVTTYLSATEAAAWEALRAADGAAHGTTFSRADWLIWRIAHDLRARAAQNPACQRALNAMQEEWRDLRGNGVVADEVLRN